MVGKLFKRNFGFPFKVFFILTHPTPRHPHPFFSADVDHDGVSNMQLVKEKTEASKLYKGKSVAEQNSVDLAWNLLMEPTYKNLRKQIYSTEEEFNRFRQLVVNVSLD